jgi:hypothetical protein
MSDDLCSAWTLDRGHGERMRGSRESVTIRNEGPRRQPRTVDRHDALNALGGLRLHWPEYLMEAGELALYMFFACAFATLLRHPASPIHTSLSAISFVGRFTDWR